MPQRAANSNNQQNKEFDEKAENDHINMIRNYLVENRFDHIVVRDIQFELIRKHHNIGSISYSNVKLSHEGLTEVQLQKDEQATNKNCKSWL